MTGRRAAPLSSCGTAISSLDAIVSERGVAQNPP
jgi:hypothetical protein